VPHKRYNPRYRLEMEFDSKNCHYLVVYETKFFNICMNIRQEIIHGNRTRNEEEACFFWFRKWFDKKSDSWILPNSPELIRHFISLNRQEQQGQYSFITRHCKIARVIDSPRWKYSLNHDEPDPFQGSTIVVAICCAFNDLYQCCNLQNLWLFRQFDIDLAFFIFDDGTHDDIEGLESGRGMW
jgi:hypothetical protein